MDGDRAGRKAAWRALENALPVLADGKNAASYHLDGTETFDLEGLSSPIKPKTPVTLVIRRANGTVDKAALIARIDTAIEGEYYRHGGILPYVLRQILK